MNLCTFIVYILYRELSKFVFWITGSTIPYKIAISLCEDDYGMITAHTRSREITFPHKMLRCGNDEDNFAAFAAAMKAVMEGITLILCNLDMHTLFNCGTEATYGHIFTLQSRYLVHYKGMGVNSTMA